ncbi:MAG: prephenate dehydrogenase/arogenate dehydrogenase family protein [Chromatiales bacterium]|nr:prephenate dehydrogenase/arogenate dehydrogenase family protein [Chromatiales bacterium]
MSETARIRRLCVIGVGLIGGSYARALRPLADEIVGSSRNEAHLAQAVELGVIDRFDTDAARAVAGADLVFVSVPLGAMPRVFSHVAQALAPDAVITDGGSVKTSVTNAARAGLGPAFARFVPGHPIAGTENSGVAASFAELYRDHKVILTPVAQTDRGAVDRVAALWRYCGAQVVEMDPAHHDEVLAATSHLPHMLAFALVDALARMKENDEIFRFAAGGFRDFTRIASSDPVMWRDICLENRDALRAMFARFRADLDALDAAVEAGDAQWILELFQRAKAARDRFTRSR